MTSDEKESDWRDCMRRLGTAGPTDLVALARRYFMEGHDYGARFSAPSQPVYDEKRLRETLGKALYGDFYPNLIDGEIAALDRALAALAAALPGLTKEEKP